MPDQDIKPATSIKRMVRLSQLVNQGKHNTMDIVSTLEREFPMYLRESHQSLISHSKNPKYNELHSLVKENEETGILSFSH